MDKLLEQNKSFDCIILDPPKLAPQRSHLLKAERAYKDLNRRAMKLLSPKGELFSFSCSAAMTTENFQKVLAWAALDANQRFKRKCLLSQPIDHPIILNFPESEYLKGIGLVQQE
jgi:23S rRNA (cytosine1962-C5)-methyltransferase